MKLVCSPSVVKPLSGGADHSPVPLSKLPPIAPLPAGCGVLPEPRPPRATRATYLRIRGVLRSLPLAVGLLCLSPTPARTQIYQWIDGSGRSHFTDNLFNVPPAYRNQIRVRSEELPTTGPTQAREKEDDRHTDVPLEKRGFGYVVRARINGRESCRLVVDTGATTTVLSPRIVGRLGIPVRRAPGIMLRTANGEVEVGWAELKSLEVGGNTVGPLRVLVHESVPNADGLLGLNFLSAFHVEIRSEGPTLRLTRP